MRDQRKPLCRFGIIRHAETSWNRQKRIQGRTETRLSPEGQESAAVWGYRLSKQPWTRILVSDMERARQTACRINETLKIPIFFEPRLREQDWGEWTGKTLEQIRNETPDHFSRQEAAGWRFRPPGGEDRLSVLKRSRNALRDAALRWPEETILGIMHKGVIKILIYDLMGDPFIPWHPRPRLKMGHLHWLACNGRVFGIQTLNDWNLKTGTPVSEKRQD